MLTATLFTRAKRMINPTYERIKNVAHPYNEILLGSNGLTDNAKPDEPENDFAR